MGMDGTGWRRIQEGLAVVTTHSAYTDMSTKERGTWAVADRVEVGVDGELECPVALAAE